MRPAELSRGIDAMKTSWKSWLLAGVTIMGLTPQAYAAAAKNGAAAPAARASQARLDALQKKLQDLDAQVQALKQAQADSDPTPALVFLNLSTSDQYVDLNNQVAAQHKPSVDNGRLQIISA